MFLKSGKCRYQVMNENDNEEKLIMWMKFLIDPDSLSDEELTSNEEIK